MFALSHGVVFRSVDVLFLVGRAGKRVVCRGGRGFATVWEVGIRQSDGYRYRSSGLMMRGWTLLVDRGKLQ